MNYICEYCGTELEKPKKVLSDQETRESFVKFVRQQQQAQLQASQIAQTQQIINSLNAYSSQTQIMNIRDSINMYQSQMISSPYQGPKLEEDKSTTADEEVAHFLWICLVCMILFALFVIGVTIIYNLP